MQRFWNTPFGRFLFHLLHFKRLYIWQSWDGQPYYKQVREIISIRKCVVERFDGKVEIIDCWREIENRK